MVIDAHQHFWYYNAQKHSWINNEMALLKRDFLPQDLKNVYCKNNIDACVAIQAEQSEFETDFLLELAEEYDFIKGVVGWVDLCHVNIEQRLQHYSRFSKIKGFRHVVQDEPDVTFMLKETFQYGISCLEEYGFTYDILIFPTQMKAALKTIEHFPNQKFVIDHIAKPYIKSGKTVGWKKYMFEMAKHSNVYCKISGMVTEADWKQWSYDDFAPWLEVVFDAFGADRVMFGSDWPVCLLGGSYERIKGIAEYFTNRFSKEEMANIWGLNAARFYNLDISTTQSNEN